MSATTTSTSLSFKPWTRDRSDDTALKDVLARVNLERGHFRDITEASLQEEIAADGAIDSSSSEDEESDEEESDEEESEARNRKQKTPTTRKELYAARWEMMQHTQAAHNEIQVSLDFISLLESRHAPKHISFKRTAFLKDVPPGTLGTDLWDQKATPVDPARKAQEDLLATKVRLASLHRSADDLLAAASRLQDNVRKETVFWDDILALSEKGWRMSKLGKARNSALGVHFGFNGSAPVFANRTVAAMIGNSEGKITLERGIGTKPKAVRVVVRKEMSVIGSSRLPSLPDQDETTLEERIRHARDSVYDEELFREMISEARALTSMGVSMRGNTISVVTGHGDNLCLEFELVSLDDDNTIGIDVSHEMDHLAQAALIASKLLLGQEHRRKIKQKKEVPAPLAEKSDDTDQTSSILRPLILLSKHHFQVAELNAYLEDVSQLLRATKASAESQPARINLAAPTDGSMDTERLIELLRLPQVSEGHLWVIISEDTTLELKIRIETLPATGFASTFKVYAPNGKEIELLTLRDTFLAADDFIGMTLGLTLKDFVGNGWKLSEREGSLSKVNEDDTTDFLWFDANTALKTITLRFVTAERVKDVVWKLEESGEHRTVKDLVRGLLL